jgi:flagellar biosynthesis protein FlhF
MNARRFVARTSRDALAAVRQALGDDAVVLSTKPCADGVEMLAMGPEGMAQIEERATTAPRALATPAPAVPLSPARRAAPVERAEPTLGASVDADVSTLSMSTLSFQDYVRERMLKRRQEALREEAATRPAPATATAAMPGRATPRAAEAVTSERAGVLEQRMAQPAPALTPARPAPELPVLHDGPPPALPQRAPIGAAALAAAGASRREQEEMMSELRQMRGLIEDRFGALAFMEKLQRQPAQAMLTQRLLDCGFSPALTRKLAESLPADAGDEMAWAAGVLERNLATAEHEPPLEDTGGVYALVGATGVGKTTTTAKIAAAFAARHGAAHLGLITLDAYRIGAHEQLRAYGRILGVPVHTAHDRASLEDLLELLSAKRMVLIDTAGMAQRDTRTRELLEMLSHGSIRKLLVVNAASQGETIEDVLFSYRGSACAGIVLSKLDEAVKLAPALDALVRHKLKVVAVANGQRVPEDWHRLSANALMHRALRGGGSTAYRLDATDVSLVFAGNGHAGAPLHRAAAGRGALHA